MKILLLFSLLLISCGSNSEPDEEEETQKTKGPDQIILGRIASVSKRGQFVLIQKFGTGTLPEGLIYQSRGPDGRTASLRPSGERVRDFFAADLVNGDAEKGDAVVAYPNQDKNEEEEKEETEEEKMNSEDENDGKTAEKVDSGELPEDGQDPQTIRDEN